MNRVREMGNVKYIINCICFFLHKQNNIMMNPPSPQGILSHCMMCRNTECGIDLQLPQVWPGPTHTIPMCIPLWVFRTRNTLGNPYPYPYNTCTRREGYGFRRVRVRVAKKYPRVTRYNHYLQVIGHVRNRYYILFRRYVEHVYYV